MSPRRYCRKTAGSTEYFPTPGQGMKRTWSWAVNYAAVTTKFLFRFAFPTFAQDIYLTDSLCLHASSRLTSLSLSIAIDIDRYLYLEREVDRESSLHLYTPPPRLAVTAVEAKPSATLSILRSCRFAWVCVYARRSKAKEQRCSYVGSTSPRHLQLERHRESDPALP